ncbi:MAG: hypothetical protein FJZ63_00725 [Chlamydiae bacterium]|nr:hypothetical protein [Chlamydiota bacterium]
MKEPKWHHYDQNLFCRLAKYATEEEAEKFAEVLGEELQEDLFSTGYKVVHTPSAFLEAIGFSDFPSAKKIFTEYRRERIISEIKGDPTLLTALPQKIAGEYLDIFKHHLEIAPEILINKAMDQMNRMPNFVVSELTRAIIQNPLESLQSDNSNYHATICGHLAMDHALQFSYDEVLTEFFTDPEQRKQAFLQLYHGLFQGAADAIKQSMNCSYFRAFDRFLNKVSDLAKIKTKNHEDYYRKQKAYLKNNGDLQDPYLIHFAVFGFYFENQQNPVYAFTMDPPDRVKLRLSYAKWLLHWINDNMGQIFSLKPGKVYCFNGALEIVEIFKVEELSLF